MSNDNDYYPYSPSDVVETLVDVYRHQGDQQMSSLLESAEASISFEEYDNWNGGQNYYSLQLRIPRKHFASLEPNIEKLQKSLKTKIEAMFKNTDPHFLTSVVIVPQIKKSDKSQKPKIKSDAIERIWGEVGFRLFISHVSEHKHHISKLKQNLSIFGVSSFVAHEDIEPTQDWQNEIEAALNTMNALTAVTTKEFKKSLWTDQEVGYALGRGIKTIAVMVGELPHGLLARQQALKGNFDNIPELAKGIVSILLKDPKTQSFMRDMLINALLKSSSWANTKLIMEQIEQIESFSTENLDNFEKALKENSQVKNAFGVPAKINTLLNSYRVQSAVESTDEFPF